MIEKALMREVSSYETTTYPSLAKKLIVSLYPLQRHNTLM